MADIVPVLSALTPAQFQALAEVPAEVEWLANITNAKTRRAYQNDVAEFSRFAGLQSPVELRTITRAHVIAWRARIWKPVSSPTPASCASSPMWVESSGA
jgi:hypothetical protein